MLDSPTPPKDCPYLSIEDFSTFWALSSLAISCSIVIAISV